MKLKDLDRYSSLVSGMCINNKGRWIEYKNVEQLLNNSIILNLDQQRSLIKLGLELIELDGKHKNFNNVNTISLIVEILDNHRFKNDNIPIVELTPTLKNDSHRHDMVFKGTNITYRLSVKKSHFWIYNRDTGQEIQYISHDSGFPNLHENWESFMEDFWNEILEDMR